MAEDPKVTKQERRLLELPSECVELTEWCWNELRPRLIMVFEAFGIHRVLAERYGAQLAARVAKDVYAQVRHHRAFSSFEGPR